MSLQAHLTQWVGPCSFSYIKDWKERHGYVINDDFDWHFCNLRKSQKWQNILSKSFPDNLVNDLWHPLNGQTIGTIVTHHSNTKSSVSLSLCVSFLQYVVFHHYQGDDSCIGGLLPSATSHTIVFHKIANETTIHYWNSLGFGSFVYCAKHPNLLLFGEKLH